MKLIGATDFLVRFPFVVEGIVIGLVGASIPLAVLYVFYDKVVVHVTSEYSMIGSLVEFVSPVVLFQGLIPIGLLLGVGIGLLGSTWTIRKHLKV